MADKRLFYGAYLGLLQCLLFSLFGLMFVQDRFLPVTTGLACMVAIATLSWGPARLILRQVFQVRRSLDMHWIAWPFAAWGVVAIFIWIISPSQEYPYKETPVYFSLAICVFASIIAIRPKVRWFILGIIIAAFLALALGSYSEFILDEPRAAGVVGSPIAFGYWSMFTGALLILISALSVKMQKTWRIGLLIIAVMALVASVMSGSRSSLLLLPILGVLLLLLHKDKFHQWLLNIGFVLILGVGALVSVSPSLQVKMRLPDIERDLTKAAAQSYQTSIGARLVMWGVAWRMFKEHPVVGAGPGMFTPTLKNLILKKEIPPLPKFFRQPHSDVLHVLATSGLVGGLAYLGIIVGPLVFFLIALRHAKAGSEQRLYAVAGLLTVGGGICAGLTSRTLYLSPAIHTLTYPLLICVFAALCKSADSFVSGEE